jgi:hypothetical protein
MEAPLSSFEFHWCYCRKRKNKFPTGGVMVMLFVPLAVVME